MNSTDKDPLISTREAGKLLGVAVRTVQLWVESGVLPAWKTAGGHRRIARSAVELLVEQRQRAISRSLSRNTPAEVGPLKMVLVDDDPDYTLLFSTMVKHWDFPVSLTTAADGFTGLVKIGQVQPDVVVTDLSMPGMDGFQMVRSLESSQPNVQVGRVIVTSALSPDAVLARGGLPDGVLYFQKPIPFAELREAVRAMRTEGTDAPSAQHKNVWTTV